MTAPTADEIVQAALALPDGERVEVARRIYASVIPAGLVVRGERAARVADPTAANAPPAPANGSDAAIDARFESDADGVEVSQVEVNERAVSRVNPDFGFFPWWPEDGDSWVCPADITLARSIIPSERVWRREVDPEEFGGNRYEVLTYGVLRLRVRKTMWRTAPHEGINVGDWVEVLPYGIKNEPQTGKVREMLIDEETLQLSYQIQLGDGRNLDKRFPATDLRALGETGLRESKRIEPAEDDGEDLELAED